MIIPLGSWPGYFNRSPPKLKNPIKIKREEFTTEVEGGAVAQGVYSLGVHHTQSSKIKFSK